VMEGSGLVPPEIPKPIGFGRAGAAQNGASTKEGRGHNVATRDLTEGTIGERAERAGVRLTGRRFETKWAPLTTEFWAMVGIIAVTLIAAAVADNFDAPRAWLIVGIVATGYIVSRGLAKAGNSHHGDDGSRRY
jgi:hypothetical protein